MKPFRALCRFNTILLLGLFIILILIKARQREETLRLKYVTYQNARSRELTTRDQEVGTSEAKIDRSKQWDTLSSRSIRQSQQQMNADKGDPDAFIAEPLKLPTNNSAYVKVMGSLQNKLKKNIEEIPHAVKTGDATIAKKIVVPPFAAKLAETKNLSLTTYNIFGRPRFSIDNDICDENTKILVYVHSATSYFKKREAMRQTWCNTTLFKDAGLKVAFFVGRSKNAILDKKIQAESDHHHDIIQIDYIDAYGNLTFKVASALTWIHTRCNHTKWIVKTDDDMVVDMYGFINQFLPKHDKAKKTMAGLCKEAGNPMLVILRDGGKWGISSDYFPGQKCYKPYCIGAITFFTGDLVAELYQTIKDVQYFWLEDIYFSRMLMERVINNTVIHLPSESIDPNGLYCLDQLQTDATSSYLVCRPSRIDEYALLWQKIYERYVAKVNYPYNLKGIEKTSHRAKEVEPKC